MRSAVVGILLLTGCAAATTPAPPAQPVPPLAVTRQVWRGSLRCGPVQGLTAVPLNQPIEVTVFDNVARYDRPVRIPARSIESGVHEHGEGTVAPDGSVTLSGGAASPPYRYSAQYSGMLRPDGETSRLSGFQKWTAPRIRSHDRPCSMMLRRGS
jgi:hypothetical protein